MERQGVRKIFHGVAQRPGKPFWFGLSARHTPVFALPGNPVSAYTCLHRYVLPALDRASGLTPPPMRWVALGEAHAFKPRLACLLPVRLVSGPQAQIVAIPAEVGTSGDFAGLVRTDGFVELPAEPEAFPAGTLAHFRPLEVRLVEEPSRDHAVCASRLAKMLRRIGLRNPEAYPEVGRAGDASPRRPAGWSRLRRGTA